MPTPRPHYMFAHHALRQVGMRDPLFLLQVLPSPNGGRFLADLLGQVAQHAGVEPDFTADQVSFRGFRVAGRPAAVLQLPPPQEVGEAWFVALVVDVDLSQEPAADAPPPPARFFTLEHGTHFSTNEPRTVLCEWTAAGAHRNFGDGPAPELRAFLGRVEALIQGDKERAD
jgi:hypothetical protein